MNTLTIVSILGCLAVCIWLTVKSKRNAENNMIDNGAQHVVSIGVLFTFIGISFGLYHFNTAGSAIESSINEFLSGMKLAFVTSIIGMIAGMVIKYFQANVEQEDDDAYRESLTDIKGIGNEVRSGAVVVSNAVRNNTVVMQGSLASLQACVEAGSAAKLGEQLAQLSSSLTTFAEATVRSQTDMQQLTESMKVQAGLLEGLSSSMKESITMMSNSQEKQLAAMGEIMKENIGQLSTQLSGELQALKNDLTAEMSRSNQMQEDLLTSMECSIKGMAENSAKAAESSVDMLAESRSYQQSSLENESKQNEILAANTTAIVGMRESFADFVENVQKVFGDAVINALNDSMNRLNDQLEEQFGENFKELNRAVEKVVVWQEQYKDIVTQTTEELRLMEKTFDEFSTVVSKNVTEHVDALNSNLQTFTATTQQNVAVQENLNASTEQLSEMVQTAKQQVEAVQNVFRGFEGFTAEVVEATNTAMREQREAMQEQLEQTVNEFTVEAGELRKTALEVTTDTNHYLRQFGETSESVMKHIGLTLEGFKADFDSRSAESLSHLEELFETLAKNTDKQHEKSVKSLAAALGKVSTQMIDDYGALLSRIAELDKLIGQNGGNRK